MWKVTEFKSKSTAQELAVKHLVKEIAEHTWAYNALSLREVFNEQIKGIKRSNNFSAENMYFMLLRNIYSVEVWKLYANGDLNYQMFQLDYVKP